MNDGSNMNSALRHGGRAFWRVLATCLVALAIGIGGGSIGRAAIELKSFTATAQANGTILVRWVTGTELNTLGFRVYRSLAATGPWLTVVHEEDARSDGEADTVYEFVDAEVTAGKTYYYLLEEIEYDDESGESRPVRYVEWIAQATVGPAGKTPAPATATPTVTSTRTPTPTATATGVATLTATPTATAAGATGAATPTATGRPTATPSLAAGATATPSAATSTATATAVFPTATSSRPVTATRPAAATMATSTTAPTGRLAAGPAAPTAAFESPLPTSAILPTPSLLGSRAPTATPTPAVFAAKAPSTPTPMLAATRPLTRAPKAEATSSGVRDDSWALLGGILAIGAAAALAGLVLYLRRGQHGRP